MSAKSRIVELVCRTPVSAKWHGTLNEANADNVVARLRKLFLGRRVAIACALSYGNNEAPQLQLSLDDFISDLCVNEKRHITWKTRDYLWELRPAPGLTRDHQNFRYAHLHFQPDQVLLVQRSALVNCLGQHLLRVCS